jgi:DNA-binding transcriptional LysR family regulator
MDLRRLEIFCKVAELHSFSKAAEAVRLAQPTVSEHISSLEESFGVKLFDRLGREIVLTKGGEILYRYAQKLLGLYQEAQQAIDKFQGRIRGRLTIGGSTIPGTYILPLVLGRFKEKYPEIQIILKISDSQEVVQDVLEGKLELGVVGAKWEDGKLDYKDFVKDILILVVPPNHPWTKKRSISIKQLREEAFIMREEGSGTRKIMEQALTNLGIDTSSLKVVAAMGSTEAVIQAIKTGVGVSIVSKRAVEEELRYGILKEVQIQEVTFQRDFYIVVNKARTTSPLCQAFNDYLLTTARTSFKPI